MLLPDEFAVPEQIVDEFDVPEPVNKVSEKEAVRNASYAAILSPEPGAVFNQVMQEYATLGTSTTVEDVKDRIRGFEQARKQQRAQAAILNSATPEDAEQEIMDIVQEPEISLQEKAIEAAAMSEETITPQEDRAHQASLEYMYDLVNDGAEKRQLLQEEINLAEQNLIGSDPVGRARFVFDTARSMYIPGFQLRLAAVGDEVFPGLLSAEDWALPGNAVRKIQDAILELPTQEDQVNKIKELVESIRRESSRLGPNEFEKWDYFDMIFADMLSEDQERDINGYILNAFSALDAITTLLPMAGPIVRGLRRLGTGVLPRVSPFSTASKVSQVSPRRFREAIQAIRNGDSGNSLGVSIEEVEYEYGLPKMGGQNSRTVIERGGRRVVVENGNVVSDVGETIPRGPDLEEDFNRAMDPTREDFDPLRLNPILRNDVSSSFFFEFERKALQDQAVHRINVLFGGLDDTMHLGKTTVSPVDGGFSVDFAIGHTAVRGFNTRKAAEAVAKRYREVQNGAKYTIEEVDGEFFARINDEYYYGSDTVQKLDGDFFTGTTSRFASYVDKDAVFDQEFNRANNIASDRSSAVLAELRRVRKPFDDLPTFKKKQVLAIVKYGEEEGVRLSPRTLLRMTDGDQEAAQGALAMTRHARTMHALNNGRVYRQLRSEGMQHVKFRVGGNTASFLGKVRTDIPQGGQVKRAYDPQTGTIVEMTDARVREMYNEGKGKIIELRQGNWARVGKQRTNYVIQHTDKSGVRIADLPTQVLREIPGYISRIYDANFIIGRKTKMIENGSEKEVFIPKAFARTLKDRDAELEVQRANAEDGEIIEAVRSTETRDLGIDQRYATRDSLEYYHDSGQLFTSGRGELLSPLREGGIDGRHGLTDILTAIQRAEYRTANNLGRRQALDLGIKRWEDTFGEMFGESGTGRMPLFGDLPRNSDDAINSKYYAQARTLRDHLLLLAGVDNSWSRIKWQGIMNDIYDVAQARGWYTIGDKALESAKMGTPLELFKRGSFVYSIVLNPLRQIVLQSQQASVYLGVDGAASYLGSGRLVRDYFNTITRGIMPDGDTYRKEFLRQVSGKEMNEYDRIYEGLRKTGLIQATDTHQYAMAYSADALESSGMAKAFFENRNSWTNPVRFLRRIGFDAGENNQLTFAFLIERNRWMKNNPKIADQWDNPENLATIGGRARQMSFNMNSAGALAFQRGAMSIPFQFMSHTVKAIQVLLPETLPLPRPLKKAYESSFGKFANRFYSQREKNRIYITQLLMFGGGSIGLSELMEDMAKKRAEQTGEVIEVPQDVSMLVREGAFGAALNLGARAIAGEELITMEQRTDEDGQATDVVYSPNFAPFSGIAGAVPDDSTFGGIPATKVVEALMNPNVTTLSDAFLGPLAGMGQSFLRQGELALAAAGVKGGIYNNLFNDPARAAPVIANEMLRIAPAYNTIWRARAAYNTGRLVTTGNDLGVSATEAESILKGILGVQTKKEQSVRDYLMDKQGFTKMIREPSDGEYNEIARTLYERVKGFLRKASEGEISPEEAIRLASLEHGLMTLAMDDPISNQQIIDRFHVLVDTDLNENQDTVLSEYIARGIGNGKVREFPEVITEIANMPPFPGQAIYVEVLKETARDFGYGGFSSESP